MTQPENTLFTFMVFEALVFLVVVAEVVVVVVVVVGVGTGSTGVLRP